MNRSHPVLFGYFAVPEVAAYQRILEHARLADDLGLDLVGIQDHPYQPRFLDALTLLTAIAVQTTRLRVLPDVVNLQMRRPAMLAKWAASLDVMTGGRVELGLGAGGFAKAVAAMGEEARKRARRSRRWKRRSPSFGRCGAAAKAPAWTAATTAWRGFMLGRLRCIRSGSGLARTARACLRSLGG